MSRRQGVAERMLDPVTRARFAEELAFIARQRAVLAASAGLERASEWRGRRIVERIWSSVAEGAGVGAREGFSVAVKGLQIETKCPSPS